MANPSVCRLWRACSLLSGFNFSRIFLHHCSLAIRQLTHQKSRRSSKRITPKGALNARGRKVAISHQYLAIARKRLKIDGYYSEILVGNRNFFLPPLHLTPPYEVAPGTIAVNVTRLERGFNACKKTWLIYLSIFNRFPVIQAWSLKIRNFSTFFAHFGLPCARRWDNRGPLFSGPAGGNPVGISRRSWYTQN